MPKNQDQGRSTLPDELREAIEAFERLQDEYANAGAGDTEPDGVFQSVIRMAVRGEEIDWPEIDWQLYDTEPDDWDDPEEVAVYNRALEAAPKLTDAAQQVVALVKKHADSRKVVDALRDYCWRRPF